MCPSLSLYFLRLKFKLGSRGTGVGYKIPTTEVLSGIDYTTTSPGLLREPGSVTENSNSFSRKQTPPGLLREPGSTADIDYRTASPGLLREPGSVLSINHW